MQGRFKILLLAALVGASMYAGTVLATPGAGVGSTLLAQGQLEEIDADVRTGKWRVAIRTKGLSDVHILENRVAPGGTFGWHSHPGPSFVTVKAGTLSFYRGDDPTCTPQTYTPGMSFVDPGGSTHVARNEGTTEVVLMVASLVPAGATRRIDEPAPGTCGF
jgi:quercetin dioxygenase-like cupin family protein